MRSEQANLGMKAVAPSTKLFCVLFFNLSNPTKDPVVNSARVVEESPMEISIRDGIMSPYLCGKSNTDTDLSAIASVRKNHTVLGGAQLSGSVLHALSNQVSNMDPAMQNIASLNQNLLAESKTLSSNMDHVIFLF